MKGSIAIALKEMIIQKFGEEKWKESLKRAGIEREPLITPITDLDDQVVMKIVNAVCMVLKISLPQAADAFGDYW